VKEGSSVSNEKTGTCFFCLWAVYEELEQSTG